MPFAFVGMAFGAFRLVVVVVLRVSFDLEEVVFFAVLIFGNKRSLSVVIVAGVHVDVEHIAARIESVVVWREAISIVLTTADRDKESKCYCKTNIIQN